MWCKPRVHSSAYLQPFISCPGNDGEASYFCSLLSFVLFGSSFNVAQNTKRHQNLHNQHFGSNILTKLVSVVLEHLVHFEVYMQNLFVKNYIKMKLWEGGRKVSETEKCNGQVCQLTMDGLELFRICTHKNYMKPIKIQKKIIIDHEYSNIQEMPI